MAGDINNAASDPLPMMRIIDDSISRHPTSEPALRLSPVDSQNAAASR
jgi:hypothetical protein